MFSVCCRLIAYRPTSTPRKMPGIMARRPKMTFSNVVMAEIFQDSVPMVRMVAISRSRSRMLMVMVLNVSVNAISKAKTSIT